MEGMTVVSRLTVGERFLESLGYKRTHREPNEETWKRVWDSHTEYICITSYFTLPATASKFSEHMDPSDATVMELVAMVTRASEMEGVCKNGDSSHDQ